MLHAAPPQPWEEMSELLRGGMIGAALADGLATTPEDAAALAASGEIRFGAAQDHAAMAGGVGSIASSTPVVVVRDEATGREAFHPVMEGLSGEALVLGMYTPAVLERLRWMREELAPMLDAALRAVGGVDADAVIAEALRRGDELHNRNAAASSMLTELLGSGARRGGAAASRDGAGLGVPAHQPPVLRRGLARRVTAGLRRRRRRARLRPGHRVRVQRHRGGPAGLGPARPVVHRARRGPRRRAVRRLHAPTTRAGPAGTRLLVECYGLGATVLAAAPALWPMVGVDEARARELVHRRTGARPRRARRASACRCSTTLPAPAGVDARRVVGTGHRPVIDIVMVHHERGRGAVGFGLTSPPMACFEAAVAALD